MTDGYRFSGLPLSPAVAEALIVELFGGRTIRRQELVDRVVSAHGGRGGASANAIDVPRTVKKALSTLKEKGFATNPSQGFWRIAGESSRPPDPVDGGESELPSAPLERLSAEVSYGEGAGAVYVYYLPAYEQLAKLQSNSVWLCKIGRSERDPMLRVLAQAGTALPEAPRVSRLIRTDMPAALESALQSILKLRGRHSVESPGNEWFETNPGEIDEICDFLGFRERG